MISIMLTSFKGQPDRSFNSGSRPNVQTPCRVANTGHVIVDYLLTYDEGKLILCCFLLP